MLLIAHLVNQVGNQRKNELSKSESFPATKVSYIEKYWINNGDNLKFT